MIFTCRNSCLYFFAIMIECKFNNNRSFSFICMSSIFYLNRLTRYIAKVTPIVKIDLIKFA